MKLFATFLVFAILATVDTAIFSRGRRSLAHNKGPTSYRGPISEDSRLGRDDDRIESRDKEPYSRSDFSSKGAVDPIRLGTLDHNPLVAMDKMKAVVSKVAEKSALQILPNKEMPFKGVQSREGPQTGLSPVLKRQSATDINNNYRNINNNQPKPIPDPIMSPYIKKDPYFKKMGEAHASMSKLVKKSSKELPTKEAMPSDVVQKKELKEKLKLPDTHVDITLGNKAARPDLDPVKSQEDIKELERSDIILNNSENSDDSDKREIYDNRDNKPARPDLEHNQSEAFNREVVIKRKGSSLQLEDHAHQVPEIINASLSPSNESNKPASGNSRRFNTEVKCPPVSYPNGRPRMRLNGKVVILRCRSNFIREGAKFAVCMHSGQWSHPFPACVENGPQTGCAIGVLLVECSVDACIGYSCPGVPGAVCRSNNCGRCSASWFNGQEEVTSRCNTNPAMGG